MMHKEIKDNNNLLENLLQKPQNSRVTVKAENRGNGEIIYKVQLYPTAPSPPYVTPTLLIHIPPTPCPSFIPKNIRNIFYILFPEFDLESIFIWGYQEYWKIGVINREIK